MDKDSTAQAVAHVTDMLDALKAYIAENEETLKGASVREDGAVSEYSIPVASRCVSCVKEHLNVCSYVMENLYGEGE